jgi:hypothetical protein
VRTFALQMDAIRRRERQAEAEAAYHRRQVGRREALSRARASTRNWM